MERENNFFYVYDKGLVKHLRYDKGIEFNCTGLNVKTNDQFWQFTKSDALYETVTAFMEIRKEIQGR
jgi:spore maturation protein CgeB